MKFNLNNKRKKYEKDYIDKYTSVNTNTSNDNIDSQNLDDSSFLDRLGKIKYAKEHASADRPMKKIKNFTKNTNFCFCCNLPCETKNVIEPFKMCDNIESFSVCGLGISLYFYLFRYSFYCTIITFLLSALPIMILNSNYRNELTNFCNNYYNFVNQTLPENLTLCNKFIDNNEYYNFTIEWTLIFSTDNLKAYRLLSKATTGTFKAVNKTLIDYNILNFFCLIILFIINFYYLVLTHKITYKEKIINCSPSDYTLFLENLDNSLDFYEDYCISKKKIEYDSQKKFENFIKFLKTKIIFNNSKKGEEEIYDINLCYKLNDFMRCEKKIHKANFKLIQIENDQKQKQLNHKYGNKGNKRKFYRYFCCCVFGEGISVNRIKKTKIIYQQKINCLLRNAKILSKTNFTGCLFLTFKTIEYKENYYSQYPHFFFDKIIKLILESKYYFCCCCISEKSKKKFMRRKNIEVNYAPEPEDVIWENLEYNKWSRFKRELVVYFISAILLAISFFIVFFLTDVKKYFLAQKNSFHFIIKYGGSLSIAAVIAIINEIFYSLIEIITKFEKQRTMTNYYLSCSVKLTFFTFCTSAIVPYVSNGVRNSWDDNDSLIDDILLIFLCNAFLTPLLWTFNIVYFIKKIKIKIIESKKNPDASHNMTQRKLNKLYQLPDMKISYKYSYLAKTLLITFFFIPIFPLGVIISIIGIILGYFLELFNFTHLYCKPEMINHQICIFYLEYFPISLLVYTLGCIAFMHDLYNNNTWLWINFFLIIFIIIIPYSKTMKLNWLGIDYQDINQENIENVYLSFYNDYQRQNPLTKIEGLKNYINKLRKNGFISGKVYKFAYMNIHNINVMELYYRSKKNFNIVKSQVALANNINNNSGRISLRKSSNKFHKQISSSSIYDEQLTNLLRESIYINNNKCNNIENLKDDNPIIELNEENNSENEKGIILSHYNDPLLLSINHNIGSGNLCSFRVKNKLNVLNNIIPEVAEINDSTEKKESEKDGDYFGVDYEVYSNKSSFQNDDKKVNIEMEDFKVKYDNVMEDEKEINKDFMKNKEKKETDEISNETDNMNKILDKRKKKYKNINRRAAPINIELKENFLNYYG